MSEIPTIEKGAIFRVESMDCDDLHLENGLPEFHDPLSSRKDDTEFESGMEIKQTNSIYESHLPNEEFVPVKVEVVEDGRRQGDSDSIDHEDAIPQEHSTVEPDQESSCIDCGNVFETFHMLKKHKCKPSTTTRRSKKCKNNDYSSFKCEQCISSFNTPDMLNRHINKKHSQCYANMKKQITPNSEVHNVSEHNLAVTAKRRYGVSTRQSKNLQADQPPDSVKPKIRLRKIKPGEIEEQEACSEVDMIKQEPLDVVEANSFEDNNDKIIEFDMVKQEVPDVALAESTGGTTQPEEFYIYFESETNELDDSSDLVRAELSEGSINDVERSKNLSQERKCKDCGNSFDTVHLLKKHKCRTSTKSKMHHSCKDCGNSFKTVHLLKKHKCRTSTKSKMHHSSFKCDQCDFSFCTPDTLNAHMNSEHSNVQIKHAKCDISGFIFRCQDCGVGFESMKELIAHRKAMNIASYGRLDETNQATNCESSLGKTHCLRCEVCYLMFKSRRELKCHISKNHKSKCGMCLAQFADVHILAKHILVVHRSSLPPSRDSGPLNFEISNAEDVMKQLGVDLDNIIENSDKNVFNSMPRTTMKDFSFASSNSRNMHEKTENFAQRKCEKCDFLFGSENLVETHMYRDRAVSTYRCEKCDLVTSIQQTLNLKIETKEAEEIRGLIYECYECGLDFKTKRGHNVHILTVHKHTCHICRFPFRDKDFLSMHMIEYHNMTPRSSNVVLRSFSEENMVMPDDATLADSIEERTNEDIDVSIIKHGAFDEAKADSVDERTNEDIDVSIIKQEAFDEAIADSVDERTNEEIDVSIIKQEALEEAIADSIEGSTNEDVDVSVIKKEASEEATADSIEGNSNEDIDVCVIKQEAFEEATADSTEGDTNEVIDIGWGHRFRTVHLLKKDKYESLDFIKDLPSPSSTSFREMLDGHLKTTHLFKCALCGGMVETLEKLNLHMKISHVKCGSCALAFKSKQSLQNHMIKKHGNKCDICGFGFQSQKQLDIHKSVQHTAQSRKRKQSNIFRRYQTSSENVIEPECALRVADKDNSSEFTCKDCACTFKTCHELNVHECRFSENAKKPRLPAEEGVNVFSCGKCPFSSNTPIELENHIYHSHQCAKCGISVENYLEHVKAKHFVQCDICQKVVNSKDVLENHKRAYKFNCETCRVCYRFKWQMLSHVSAKHKYYCDICAFPVETVDLLEVHVMDKHGLSMEEMLSKKT